MRVVLPGDQRFVELASIPEFSTAVVTASSKVVHLVGIIVHPSDHLTMAIIQCPVKTA